MDVTGLLGWPSWVGIVVEDLEGQRRFWRELLGVAESDFGPDYVAFEMEGGRRFELIKRSSDPEYDGLRFQVGFEVEDIQSARDELIRRGVEPISELFLDAESPWAYFRDPEGNVFEIKHTASIT
jgi:predicted enzyme related to lactoylglutathione lyase